MTLSLCAALCLVAAPRPTVWMMPPGGEGGRCWRELFEHPEQWAETRARVDYLGAADHVLHRQYTDAELGAWLPKLGEWGLKLGLEVGAVKEWATTGQKCFDLERVAWDRFQHLGGPIGAVAFDEPLCCVRQHLKKPDSYAVDETAAFIALVRSHYPQIKVGDIEPYPYLSVADLTGWIDALQAKLATMGVRGLDFFRVDVDWLNFVVGRAGSWREVRRIEDACRARKLPFSLIYWAANYPMLKSKGLADDSTWYVSTMGMAQDYVAVGGRPDEVVIESWVGAPSHSVPETESWTFTRSVLDLCRTFVPGVRP